MKFGASLAAGMTVVSFLLGISGCGGSSSTSGVTGSGATGSGGSGADGSGASAANGSGANGSGASAGTLSLNLGGSSDSTGGTGTGTGGSPEICDGIDNDNNGIIDDVDQNGDGVCDCLLIATLGLKGTWGIGDVFATWLSARSNNGAADLADQVLTPELLAKYQVIVAQNVSTNHRYADSEVATLTDWVNKGGGFMTLIGYSNAGEEANVNRLLAPLSMSYGDRQILPKNGASTFPITTWTPHPVDTGVTAVGVDTGCAVQGMGTTFATGGGFDVGKAQTVGNGHVLMWGDEWITYNSEWVNHPDYQVQLFWLNAIKWLTVAGNCQVAIPPNPPK